MLIFNDPESTVVLHRLDRSSIHIKSYKLQKHGDAKIPLRLVSESTIWTSCNIVTLYSCSFSMINTI